MTKQWILYYQRMKFNAPLPELIKIPYRFLWMARLNQWLICRTDEWAETWIKHEELQ